MAVTRKSAAAKLTYRDYVALPQPHDARRYEILDGDVVVTPSPLIRHQDVSQNLFLILRAHVSKHRLGRVYYAPVDVILHRNTVVVPDLVFVTTPRASIVTERAVEGPPDLLVEVLSPSTARRDRGIKARLYARFGVPHYWMVDPRAQTLTMYEARGTTSARGAAGAQRPNRPALTFDPGRTFTGRAKATSSLFPSLVIDLGKVWPTPFGQ